MTYIADKGVTSLRDLFYQLNHTGTKADLTTFSKASKTRGCQLFIRIYQKIKDALQGRSEKKDKHIICPFDSTTITLTSKLFWAHRYHQVKLLTSVDEKTKTPNEILIHYGQSHDINFGEMILTTIPENAIAVGDRGFASRELFTEYIKNGVMFVIRINTNWKTGEDGCLDIEQKKVRVVQFYDLETRKEYRIATNISEEIMSNEDIGDVYRKRWEIEVLWKFLKMHLKLDRLATKNINGVTIQIYMILIVYLMLQLVEMPTIYGTKLLDKLRYLQITIRREGNFIHWMNKVASGIEL